MERNGNDKETTRGLERQTRRQKMNEVPTKLDPPNMQITKPGFAPSWYHPGVSVADTKPDVYNPVNVPLYMSNLIFPHGFCLRTPSSKTGIVNGLIVGIYTGAPFFLLYPRARRAFSLFAACFLGTFSITAYKCSEIERSKYDQIHQVLLATVSSCDTDSSIVTNSQFTDTSVTDSPVTDS